jgi:hypothetical protein
MLLVRCCLGRTPRHLAKLVESVPLDSEPSAGLARVAGLVRHMDWLARYRQAGPTPLRDTTLYYQSRIENEISWILSGLDYTTQCHYSVSVSAILSPARVQQYQRSGYRAAPIGRRDACDRSIWRNISR